MGKRKKELSHTEVWDDSALIQSWDDALAEYKLYHSIHARGERVDHVIKDLIVDGEGKFPENAQSANGDAYTGATANSLEDLEDGEVDEEPRNAGNVINGDSTGNIDEQSTSGHRASPSRPRPTSAEQQPKPLGMVDAVTNGVGDEGLKNLMMSWYYAGYYTGLYEGQQQAQKDVPK